MGGFAIAVGRAIWWFGTPIRHVLQLWTKHFWRSITDEGGYRIVIGMVATLVGAYFGLYTILEARHERHLNRALFERSAFMTMVVTGPNGFRSAMDQFAQLQNQKAPIKPDLSMPPWKWFGEYTPNREPLWQWALNFMDKCEPKMCGTLPEKDDAGKANEGSKAWRINLRNANLRNADLRNADLMNAYLQNVDLRNANLWYANLRNANLVDTDLGGADLVGTNNLAQGQIEAACIYKSTKLPAYIKRPKKNPEGCPQASEQ